MIKAIVTDIEGTTSSLSFVKEVLFPYARQHLGDYIRAHVAEPQVAEQIEAIRSLVVDEAGPDATPAIELADIIDLLNRWIDEDRKLTPLKALQGLVWEQGYRNGDFHGHIYADAVQLLRAWHEQGIDLYIYSSGSVYAQKLLFSHTEYGDLTPLFADYFDTRIGAKGEAASYRRIAGAVGVAADDILFLSDIDTELDAAQQAGFQTWQLVRDDGLDAHSRYRQARNFEEIVL
jgi:enolase-phosphatase E1